MLLVQKFLETHSFKELQEQHGVYISVSKSKYKFSLNYSMIEAKETDPLANQCRGLVLATTDGKPLYCELDANGKRNYENIGPGKTIVLAYAFDRFFNYGQGCAANINWSDPKLAVLEKLDGTLCIVYYDKFIQQWCVATRSVCEADLPMDNGIFTFRTLFEKAWYETLGYSFDKFDAHQDRTYCFELTTPLNKIVCSYSDYRITLLAVRDITTLQELDPTDEYIVEHWRVPYVQAHTYTSVSDLLDWVSSLNPLEHEGVVVRDANFNRIKVKNAAYVAAHKLNDKLGTSERNCLELILLEKDDDAASFLPDEIVKNLQKIKTGLQAAIQQYDIAYQAAVASIAPGDKKAFALLITQNKQLWTAPLFAIFGGKAANMKDFIQKNRKDGSWNDSFLDKLLEISKGFSS